MKLSELNWDDDDRYPYAQLNLAKYTLRIFTCGVVESPFLGKYQFIVVDARGRYVTSYFPIDKLEAQCLLNYYLEGNDAPTRSEVA